MKAIRMAPYGSHTFHIQVSSYQDGELKGVVSGPALPQPTSFTSFARLVLLLDDALDLPHREADAPTSPPARHPLASLELEILFRQNYSWQGKLRWLDTGREAAFRSVLELIELLETVLAA